jgi:hypothetical protein
MKHPQNKAYETLTQVIDNMVAERLDRNTIDSLRAMLSLPAFLPIINVIEKKIIEVGNHLKSKEPKQGPIEVYMGNHNPSRESMKVTIDLVPSIPMTLEEMKAFYDYKNLNDSINELDVIIPDWNPDLATSR